MIRSDRCLAAVLASLLLAAPLHAFADASEVQKSTANALFADGKKLMDAKDYDAACPKLAESAKLQPGGGVQLALALCHESQGKVATAVNDYREALALAKRDKRKDREDIASGKLAELEPKLSRLVVNVTEAAKQQSVTLELDDVPLTSASWGVAIPVDGGKHVVVVAAPGKASASLEITVAAQGDRKVLEVGPLEGGAKATPPVVPEEKTPVTKDVPPPSATSSSGVGVGPLILGGVGLVALGVGTVFGIKALGASSEVKNGCPGGECATSDLVDRNDDARRSARLADVGIGVGVLAISGAVLWWAMTPSGANTASTTGIVPSRGRLLADVSPRGASLGWVMRW